MPGAEGWVTAIAGGGDWARGAAPAAAQAKRPGPAAPDPDGRAGRVRQPGRRGGAAPAVRRARDADLAHRRPGHGSGCARPLGRVDRPAGPSADLVPSPNLAPSSNLAPSTNWAPSADHAPSADGSRAPDDGRTPQADPPSPRPAAPAAGALAPAGRYSVQVGAFRDPANASAQAARLSAAGYTPRIVHAQATQSRLYMVRLGAFDDRSAARAYAGQIAERLDIDTWPVAN
ncbi:MAG: SPOR domain-containing protein [Rhodovibrio sp.]|nr:SPOR domain-containing protein [Rhodovibrio sp.]